MNPALQYGRIAGKTTSRITLLRHSTPARALTGVRRLSRRQSRTCSRGGLDWLGAMKRPDKHHPCLQCSMSKPDHHRPTHHRNIYTCCTRTRSDTQTHKTDGRQPSPISPRHATALPPSVGSLPPAPRRRRHRHCHHRWRRLCPCRRCLRARPARRDRRCWRRCPPARL